MNNPIDKTRQREIDAEEARVKLRANFEAAGVDYGEPWTAAAAAAVLRDIGYTAPPGIIGELIRKSYVGIADPEEINAAEMYAIIIALESRKRWAPYPNPKHDLKKSQARLTIEKLVADGCENPVTDLEAHTVEDLLLSMANADQRWLREYLYEVLRLKLKGLEE